MLTLKNIEERFVAWGTANPDIRLALVVGSQARTDHPADAWSDLDIILFAHHLERYRDQLDWITALAPVWVSLFSYTVAGEPERLVLYDGGLQVDYVFNDAAAIPGIVQVLQSGQIPDTVYRGVRVLFDKDNAIPPLPAPGKPPLPPLPTPQQFTQTWENFWFSAVHAAKQLRRGDLPYYKGAENGLRQLLLPFLEWRTLAHPGKDADTWHKGRFIREWLAPHLYDSLSLTYTPLETAASWQGLLRLVELFSSVAHETAAAIPMEYPQQLEAELRGYIQSLYQDAGV